MPNGKTITITFSVTLNNPPNLAGVVPPKISQQGTLAGAFSGNPIVTDDPNTGAANDATVTPVDLPDTTTTVSSSQNPSFVGQNVQFTATVSSPGGVPTGTVQFRDGPTLTGTALGSPITLTTGGGCPAGSACATTPNISSLTAGNHTITADYTNTDGNFDSGTGKLLPDSPGQTVNNKTATTTTVLSSLNPSNVGDAVTFTAQVNSASATGTVQFWDGPSGTGTPLGSPVSLTTGGSCPGATACASTAAISNLTAGNHTITADYSGDVAFNASTGKLLPDPPGQTVNKKATTTTVTSSPNPSNFGQSVTFSAHVAGAGGTPTGTVQFKDNGTNLGGAQTLNGSGDATFITSSLSAGTHTPITADYSGDAQFAVSTGTLSSSPDQVVNSCAANVTVANNTDAAGGSLRDALSTVCDGGTITFDPVAFAPVGGPYTITLTTGELAISKNLTITGPTNTSVTVSGNDASRVFNISAAVTTGTVGISNLTVAHGSTPGGSGAGLLNNSAATINLTGLSFTNNVVVNGAGGALASLSGTMNITSSTFSANTATGYGGAIYNQNGTTNILNTTIAGNSATKISATSGGWGGGVFNTNGTTTVTNSTISGNTAVGTEPLVGLGGGIFNEADPGATTLTVTNSTVSGNGADNDGGGIYNRIKSGAATATATLTSVTVTNNRADNDTSSAGTGGGINVVSGTFTLRSTIVFGNFVGGSPSTTADDIKGTVDSSSASSFNLIGTGGAGGLLDATNNNQVGVADAKLGALADNGGPTKTHALLDTSPAIDTGNNFALTTLNGAIDNVTTSVTVTDASNIPAGLTIRVESEQMVVVSKALSVLTVTRGANGTTAAAHADTTSVFSAFDQRGFPRTINFDGLPPAGSGDDTDIGAFERQFPSPTIAKAFGTSPIQSGGTSTVTLTLTNPNAFDVHNAAFTDTLVNMKAVGGGVGGTCVGITPNSLAPNATALSFSSITIPASGNCSVTFDVTSSTPGVLPNTTSGVTTTETPAADAASNTANLTVLGAATIAKVFNPATIQPGGTSTVTLTLTNTNGSQLTNASFTDTLVNMSAVGGSVAGTCAGTTPNTLNPGDTNLSFIGITIPANSNCTVTFDVTSSTSGINPNTTSGVTTDQTAIGAGSNTANLSVTGTPTINKAFVPDTIQSGGTSTITLTLTNTNGTNLTNASFSDTLVNMSAVGGAVGGSCVGTTPNNLAPGATSLNFSGITIPANGNCTVTFAVTSSTVGTNPNSTSGITTSQTPLGAASNTVNLTVLAPPTISKGFSPDKIQTGGTSTVTLTLTNSNGQNLTGASFTDTLVNMSAAGGSVSGTCSGTTPNSLAANATALSFSGITIPASGNCTVIFDVKGSTAGTNPNATSGVATTQTPVAGAVSNTANLMVFDPPVVSSIVRADADPTSSATVHFTVTFSKPVTGVNIGANSDFALSTTGISGASITGLSGSGAVYTVTVNTGSGDGTVGLNVVDDDSIQSTDALVLPLGGAGAANGNFNTGQVYTVDRSNPSVVSITRAGSNPTNAASVLFTVTFSENVSPVATSDFALTTTGVAGSPAVTNVSGSGTTYTVTVSTGTGDGTIRLDLNDSDGTIRDQVNKTLTGPGGPTFGAFTTGEVYNIDKTAPSATVSVAVGQLNPVTGPTASTVINFKVVFSEPIAAGTFTNTDVAITGTALATVANVSQIAPNDGTTFNVAVEGMTQSGTVIVDIPAGSASDLAGNLNTVSTSTDKTVTFFKDDFTTFEVNSLADTDDGHCDALGTGTGNKDCTLREAINAANADAGAETITFNSVVFAPAGGPYTINLTGALPDLSTDMTISGPGANVLTVKRNTGGNYRIFLVLGNVTIDGLTISNGNASVDFGGGIDNGSAGTVNVTNSTISGNTAAVGGGGIFHFGTGTLNVTNSTISGNSAAEGGGIRLFPSSGSVNVTNSTVSGNTATGDGGGIINYNSTLTISNSTITNNRADNDNNGSGTGGGINRNSGTVTLRNTIVAQNFNGGVQQVETATVAGTITGAGNATVVVTAAGMANSPKTVNVAVAGGDTASVVAGKMRTALAADLDIRGFFTVSGATDKIILTALSAANDATMNIATNNGTSTGLTPAPTSANTSAGVAGAAADINGAVNSEGFNLIQSTSGATITETLNAGTNITGQNPQLSPLANNGGPTFTHALQCTSPAIDKGKSFGLTTDQRGGTRPFDLADSVYPNAAGGDASDIGAYETQTGGGCLPLAVPPSTQPSTNEDTQVTITLKGTYSQNFALTFSITQPPVHSTAALVPSAANCAFTTFMMCTSTVSYTPSANFNGLDAFKFKASAGGLDSEEADVNITVIPVNDQPLAQNQSVITDEDTSLPITLTGSDVETSPGSLTFTVTVPPAHGTLSGTAPNVTYTPNLNYNGPDSFKFTVTDTGDGPSPPLTSNPATVSITVNAVNDAPVLDNTGNMSLTAINEDVAAASNNGTLVSGVIASAGGTRITDVDAGAVQGLAVIAVDNTNGTWQFSIDNGTNWAPFGAPNSLTARLLAANATTRVRFLPNLNFNGTVDPGLTFRAWDQTSGTNGNTADVSIVGGTTAFSIATETASITVNPVNDAPTADSQSTATNEDTPLPVTLTGSDVETPSGSLIFNISVPPTHGTLSGTGANRTYTPNLNYNGPDSFKFTVTDTGDGSSPALTSAEATVSITVNAVNDAPSFTKGPDQTVNGAVAQTITNWATNISAGPPDESGQSLTFLVSNNNNAIFSAQPAISPTGTLTYTPAYGFDGSATVTVRLQDNGGTALGGVDTSAPQTFAITVHALNNPPTLDALANVTINEDAPLQTVNLAGITAGPSFESSQSLTITATSNNTAVIPNPTVTYSSPNPTGSISFTPVPDANGSATITVTVKDDGGTNNGGVDTFVRTFIVTVNPINDAPVNHVPGPQTIPINTSWVFSAGTGNAIFISDVDAFSDPVQVTLKATDGTITLNGTTGLTFSTGDGTDDPLMTFTGSIANINAALEGMKNLAFGSGVIQITTNDLGHNGIGGPLSDTDTIQVTVNDNLAPVLLTIPGSDRAIAFESPTFVTDPFSLVGNNNFTADYRTRIALFALHAQLRPGETASAITAEAEVDGTIVPLTVEFVGTVPNFDWLTQIVVKLPDHFSTGGGGPHDAKIRIRLRGQDSNQAVIIVVPAPKP